jgi:hypothetical protein
MHVDKNVLFEHKKIKLWNKWNFMENKRNYIAWFKYALNFVVT